MRQLKSFWEIFIDSKLCKLRCTSYQKRESMNNKFFLSQPLSMLSDMNSINPSVQFPRTLAFWRTRNCAQWQLDQESLEVTLLVMSTRRIKLRPIYTVLEMILLEPKMTHLMTIQAQLCRQLDGKRIPSPSLVVIGILTPKAKQFPIEWKFMTAQIRRCLPM